MKQTELILRHLQDFGSISAAEAMAEYGIFRLASRISDLRKDGYNITKTTGKSKNRYGKNVTFAIYRME